MEPSHRLAVVHGVERGDLVDPHRRHLQQPRHIVHDADAREAVLALAQVEKRHHGRFLVLRRVALEDLGDELLVGGVELKGDLRVVLRAVSVLKSRKEKDLVSARERVRFFFFFFRQENCANGGQKRTTCRASLPRQAVAVRNRR